MATPAEDSKAPKSAAEEPISEEAKAAAEDAKKCQTALQTYVDAVGAEDAKEEDKQAASFNAAKEVADIATKDNAVKTDVVDAIAELDSKASKDEDKVYFRLKKALNGFKESDKEKDEFKNADKVRAAIGSKLAFFGVCGPEPDSFLGIPLLCGMLG